MSPLYLLKGFWFQLLLLSLCYQMLKFWIWQWCDKYAKIEETKCVGKNKQMEIKEKNKCLRIQLPNSLHINVCHDALKPWRTPPAWTQRSRRRRRPSWRNSSHVDPPCRLLKTRVTSKVTHEQRHLYINTLRFYSLKMGLKWVALYQPSFFVCRPGVWLQSDQSLSEGEHNRPSFCQDVYRPRGKSWYSK